MAGRIEGAQTGGRNSRSWGPGCDLDWQGTFMKQRMARHLAGSWRLMTMAMAMSAPASAQDRAEVERTPIVGNRELPKVLYIVPWKQPLPGVPSGKPLQSVLDETLAPLDRAVFRRQIEYGLQLQNQLQSQSQSRELKPTTNVPTGEPR